MAGEVLRLLLEGFENKYFLYIDRYIYTAAYVLW